MSAIKKLIVLFSEHQRRQLLLLSLGLVIVGLVEAVGIASIIPFISVVTEPEIVHTNEYLQGVYTFFEFDSTNDFIVGLGILVLLILVVGNAFLVIINWKVARFSQMQTHYVSTRLLTQYLYQPYKFFLGRNTSDLSKNIHFEVQRCMGGVVIPLMQAFSRTVVALFLTVLLIVVDPVVALTAVFVLGASYWVIYNVVRSRLHIIGEKSTKTVGERFKVANEAMSGIKDIKLKGCESEFIESFSTASEKNARYATQSNVISITPRYALETIAFGGIVFMMIYLILNDQQGGDIVPLISLYALSGYKIMPALQQIYGSIANIKFHLPLLNILVDEMQSTNLLVSPKNNSLAIELRQKIQLKSVDFQYDGAKSPVLNKLSMDIHAKTTIGIVGSTGSGKTTLVDIILGLLPIKSGKMFVDDILINSSNIHNWQKNFGYVPQEIYLKDDTIANNIAFSDRIINQDSVIRASKLAELDKFVQTLPDKYNTIVGERGVRLSGGQRQRIGIARAMYNDPNILVFDEATSALDGITENVVMDAIHNLTHKKTIIIIAHRLTTVKDCDVIHVVESGEVAMSGTYEELVVRNEQFRKMLDV